MTLHPKTRKDVDYSINAYEEALIANLFNNAIEAHIAGDMVSHKMLKIPITKNIVQQEALNYGKTYQKLLKDKGASIIKGKEVPWLSEHIEHTRNQAYNIIEDGLKQGRPVADIGGKRGAPGTIADDLKQLGIRDKDYEYVRIARTETARIQNQGALNRFDINNIVEVDVVDGTDFDAECAAANGQRWPVSYARNHELEHPNCTRAFTPVIPNDWEPPENT